VKLLKEQGRRAMMALLQKSKLLHLPISTQIELFNALVRPIITYGCEIWGYSCLDIIESLHLEYLKYILRMKKTTPDCFVYGETGNYPLYIHVYYRMIKFWHKLRIDKDGKISTRLLHTLLECHNFKIYTNDWLFKIKQILDESGLSFVWDQPQLVTTAWLGNALLQRQKDMYLQMWKQKCDNCGKALHYSMFKDNFGFEQYLDNLPDNFRIVFTKFRTSNHKLPVEKGRYVNIPREERTCTLCETDTVGDEYHILLECPFFTDLRAKYIPRYYRIRPNFYKYSNLMSNTVSRKKLLNLCKFVFECFKFFK
jgi:hypothetical protein